MFDPLDKPSPSEYTDRPFARLFNAAKVAVLGAISLAISPGVFGVAAYYSGKEALKLLTHTPIDGLDLLGGGALGIISLGTGLVSAVSALRSLALLPKYVEKISDAAYRVY